MSNFQEHVKKSKLCTLCLGKHTLNNCTSKWKCFTCQGRHNTSLHVDQNNETNASANMCINNSHTTVLLATALIKINNVLIRVLLDQGSTASFISENAVQVLKLRKYKGMLGFDGIDATNSSSRSYAMCTIAPHFQSDFSCTIKTYVLRQKPSVLPHKKLGTYLVNKFNNLCLADPHFNVPTSVDMLLGSDILSELMLKGIILGSPLAQETKLGWIISGQTKGLIGDKFCNVYHINVFDDKLDIQLEKFWEVEELDNKIKYWTQAETDAEKFYKHNHYRDVSGK